MDQMGHNTGQTIGHESGRQPAHHAGPKNAHPASWAGINAVGLNSLSEVDAEGQSALRMGGDSLAELAHDARNMVTALTLYCDLLEQPGVLHTRYSHFGPELRLIAAASHRLVDKMVALEGYAAPTLLPPGQLSSGGLIASMSGQWSQPRPASALPPIPSRAWETLPAVHIEDLASDLLANRNLLAALAGPGINLKVEAVGASLPLRLSGEDLTRVLVNLVKNAAQAMPAGGAIHVHLRPVPMRQNGRETARLVIEDDGPGIAPNALEKVFEPGYSTLSARSAREGWPASHRGLGLSITRSIVEGAGGCITASNLNPHGARFTIELPVRRV